MASKIAPRPLPEPQASMQSNSQPLCVNSEPLSVKHLKMPLLAALDPLLAALGPLLLALGALLAALGLLLFVLKALLAALRPLFGRSWGPSPWSWPACGGSGQSLASFRGVWAGHQAGKWPRPWPQADCNSNVPGRYPSGSPRPMRKLFWWMFFNNNLV